MTLAPRLSLLALAASTALWPLASSHAQTLGDAVACYGALVANPSASGVSGVAVTLLKDDQVILRQGFGVVSPGNTRAVLPTTRFRTGSTLKAMTATALLSLADQRLPVDATPLLNSPVGFSVPGLALPGRDDWTAQLTPRQLISHQGALQDDNNANGRRDAAGLLAHFRDITTAPPPAQRPGTIFNYSNSNFMLAGAVVESASGQPYTQAMAQRVFSPLGMTRMTFSTSAVQADGDFAYGIQGSQIVGPDAYYRAAFAPAGLAWGSVDDLTKWARFLMKGNSAVLSNGYWQAMVTPKVNTYEVLDLQSYGYGVFLRDYVAFNGNFYRGVPVREHGGFVDGYSTNIVTYPTLKVAIAVLANGSSEGLDTCQAQALGAAVADRLPAPSAFPTLAVQAERFPDYVGAYDELVPDSRAVVGRHSLRVNATTGGLEIEFPFLDQLNIPYSRQLIPVWRDAFVTVIQGFPLLLNGFRPANAQAGSTVLLKNRLFVGHRVSNVPGVYPPFVFKGTSELAAQLAALQQQLQQTATFQRGQVVALPDNMRGAYNQAVQRAKALAR